MFVATHIYSTVTVKVGGRKAWSSTQSSGMPSTDKLAGKSTPRNKASRQANSNTSRGGFPKKVHKDPSSLFRDLKINGKDFLFLIKGGCCLVFLNNIPALKESAARKTTKSITTADEMKGGWNSPEKQQVLIRNQGTDGQYSSPCN